MSGTELALSGLYPDEKQLRIARWLADIKARTRAMEAASSAAPKAARCHGCRYLLGSPGHQAECGGEGQR
jgi:hypothetical protein